MMRTNNPVLNQNTFGRVVNEFQGETGMTAQGAATKTLVLLALAVATATWTWHLFFAALTPADGAQAVIPWLIGGLIGGLVFSMVTVFKAAWAPITAPIYALLEGLVLGSVSALFEQRFPNIVLPAVGLTFGTALAMLLAYKLGLVRATEKFKLGVIAATGGIALLYLVSIVLGFFGVSIPFIHSATPLGIAFSAFVCIIAALNLVLDFDFIETAAAQGAPKSMEWYGAFGLMVTLVWLYLEILRLLSKLRER